jgi:hypothetical protein
VIVVFVVHCSVNVQPAYNDQCQVESNHHPVNPVEYSLVLSHFQVVFRLSGFL